ncbi:UbiD family decarboxylase [Alienimonas chondri]|uniref:4-hydroxybenzoate decarboxylase subunit C n=1 Tax=Alienimonas chondri TaxID=2681879 RepID=A0ABX1V734_9PLAN|nr:UbiD family decarboxylase [Alienimonas chondri]NNJ24045.1 4-hydroxybenzoate decarboxylase subunit C [Alienimonas chondri]
MHKTLRHALDDLDRHKRLLRIAEPIDPHLEAAEIQRRVYAAGGPALLFENVVGCRFPMASNLFGTLERAKFLFRHTLKRVEHLVDLKVDPTVALKAPWKYFDVPLAALTTLPKRTRSGPVLKNRCAIRDLPQMVSWPDDGGPFVTLPQVYTEDPGKPGVMNSNLGMYRVQLGGNEYVPDEEIGLHYQLHRSIGVHHAAAIERGEELKVNVFVGGAPAMTLSAVMPLPEGLSELIFAGALAGRRIPMAKHPLGEGWPRVYGEADFCLSGRIVGTKPEGPFGDHLGYYAKVHDFPVLKVEAVYHRDGAVWPFTVVGRPPQEDTSFGELIHEITGPALPTVLPGVKGVHAVDAAGVHPLLLATGSERYSPHTPSDRPAELLTQANAILGQGQLSLAKYLFIADAADDPPAMEDVPAFLMHCLARIDPTRDLHFQTRTTIDTLDYSGSGLNEGSKVVLAARGPVRRELPEFLRSGWRLPDGFDHAAVAFPGVACVSGPSCETKDGAAARLAETIDRDHPLRLFPLIVLCDDAAFSARTANNLLWTAFTRSNPAADLQGVDSFTEEKHWGCRGPLIIDARVKPHHAPPLIEDPHVTAKVDRLAERGGPLHGVL